MAAVQAFRNQQAGLQQAGSMSNTGQFSQPNGIFNPQLAQTALSALQRTNSGNVQNTMNMASPTLSQSGALGPQIDITNIPTATSYMGKVLQAHGPPRQSAFETMLKNLCAKNSQPSSVAAFQRKIENQLIQPYTLFCVVQKFGGSEEVSIFL